jgi:DNA-binding SARP family transcriptional activator
VEFRILGPLEVFDEDGRSLPLGGLKQRALLAILLLHANEVVSSEQLIDELWGDEPPETAQHTVRVYVSRLRKALPRDALVTKAGGYALQVRPGELDLTHFEELVGRGRHELAAGDAAAGTRTLDEALALWRGRALAEFAGEPFVRVEADRLEELRLAALMDRLDADLAVRPPEPLVAELEGLVATHRFRERLRGQLMLALYRSAGRRTP